jgi:GNAT superfamily N-acetyltransferase
MPFVYQSKVGPTQGIKGSVPQIALFSFLIAGVKRHHPRCETEAKKYWHLDDRSNGAVAIDLWIRSGIVTPMQTPDQYEISTERSRMDLALIHDFLRSSYWARGIPRAVVEKSIRHSLCFGAFFEGRQAGFARVISDFAAIAYVADVFVVPEHRGRGVSKLLLGAIMGHPELQGLRRMLLVTRDAHGLYAKFGFQPLAQPENFMTVHNPHVYRDENVT